VIESSLLGPAAITTHLADMGADVIKVEAPAGARWKPPPATTCAR
jgi:crotonobetainyl-CoA:carnitine CoA-transferase CaiB-like acyl-CoA transferase